MAKALAQNGRDGAAVGLGCDDIGVASTKAGDPAATKFLGCVAYFPEKYPDYLVSIGARRAGRQAGAERGPQRRTCSSTRTTSASVYP